VSEKMVMVGVLPEAVVIDASEQVVWFSNAGNIKIEFDAQRSPFGSNVFQAPPGIRLSSGAARPGINSGSYRYRLSLNDVIVAQCEVIIRAR
jgi:hypothetical protein